MPADKLCKEYGLGFGPKHVWPDLNTMMVFLKDVFEKNDLQKNICSQQKCSKLPPTQRVKNIENTR